MEPLPDFQLLKPRSVAEAVTARAASAHARFLAGGTDLLANLRSGLIEVDTLIDLGAIPELHRLEAHADGIRIGAGVTLEELAAHPQVARDYPALAQAAAGVAGPTHRAVATVGGNLCLDTRCRFYNQSEWWRAGNQHCLKLAGDTCRVALKADRCYAAFSGDLAPALMVHGAVAEIAGAQGRRELPLGELYADEGRAYLNLAPHELLVALRLPAAGGLRSGYEKIRIRAAIDFPLTGVAVALRRDGERVGELCVAATGTESRPLRFAGLEVLQGMTRDAALVTLDKLIRKQLGMMETHLVSAGYRRRATLVVAKRLVQRLFAA